MDRIKPMNGCEHSTQSQSQKRFNNSPRKKSSIRSSNS
jgi:hypothetical protein